MLAPPPPSPALFDFDPHLDFVLLDPREVSRQLPDKRSVTPPPPPPPPPKHNKTNNPHTNNTTKK